MTIKLDRPKVKHSRASKENDRVWFYEELEGEILDFAEYMKKHYDIKYNDTAREHLKRIGRSIHNLKVVSSLGMGNLEDLYQYGKPKKSKEPLKMKTEETKHYKSYEVKKKPPKQKKINDESLKEMAMECFRGTLFTSQQVEPNMITSVFMPLALMDPVQSKNLYNEKPTMVYAYMKDAAPQGINGYPIFWSCGTLDIDETKKFNDYYQRIVEACKNV